MSFSDVVSRISQLESLSPSTIGSQTLQAELQGSLPGIAGTSFARVLAAATVAQPAAATGSPGDIVAAARGEIGQTEQPPGSNDSPRIAVYRSAVAGAQAGDPWCAYFVSWAAAQAGMPLGDNGAGIGSVAGITDWASRNGRLLPASATPQPGDLILFGTEHVGIVESVSPDGSLTTIEGNHANAVQEVDRKPGEATGFVRMG